MKKILSLVLTLVLAVTAAHAQQLVAGAAKVDITPSSKDLVRPIDSIRGKLYVKALYVSDGHSSTAIVSIDAGARGLESAIQRSSASTGIPYENYIVSSTHTHSGGIRNGTVANPSPETIQDALIKAVAQAKAAARPARVGYGKRPLDLNVNRDNYNEFQEWQQAPNWTAPADKDLTVLAFLDQQDIPIAVYMNYGMHPVNFYLSGVVSADYPGDACELVEKVFGGNTVALFSQGSSGDVNPKLAYSDLFREGQVKGVRSVRHANRGAANLTTPEMADVDVDAYKANIERKSEYVKMLGNAVAFKAMEIMLFDMQYETDPVIKGAETVITLPGRERIDKEGRENYDPGYKDADDVNIGVGYVQIGDIGLVTVSGEIYTEIGLRIKHEMPVSKLMVVTLADGPSGSGYIYSNNASNHLTFQVIGSRLQPGHAENAIVEAAKKLVKEAK